MLNSAKQREDSSGTPNQRSFQTSVNPLRNASRSSPTASIPLGDRDLSETPVLLAGCVTLGKLLDLSEPQFAHPRHRKDHNSTFFIWLI